MSPFDQQVAAIADGVLSGTQIAERLGCTVARVKKALARNPHIPRRRVGPPPGERNPSWRGGRIVDLDGYVLLSTRPTRILEHRSVMERKLGRLLLPGEVVDHVDGITIHNDPTNLRVFASNSEHLASTIAYKAKQISQTGKRNVKAQKKNLVGRVLEPVDTYRLRKERGDVRLHAILRAALELGIRHPCLLGTTHWLEQSGIDPTSRPSLERAWADLMRRYDEDLAR
jgi:hypothetical protein